MTSVSSTIAELEENCPAQTFSRSELRDALAALPSYVASGKAKTLANRHVLAVWKAILDRYSFCLSMAIASPSYPAISLVTLPLNGESRAAFEARQKAQTANWERLTAAQSQRYLRRPPLRSRAQLEAAKLPALQELGGLLVAQKQRYLDLREEEVFAQLEAIDGLTKKALQRGTPYPKPSVLGVKHDCLTHFMASLGDVAAQTKTTPWPHISDRMQEMRNRLYSAYKDERAAYFAQNGSTETPASAYLGAMESTGSLGAGLSMHELDLEAALAEAREASTPQANALGKLHTKGNRAHKKLLSLEGQYAKLLGRESDLLVEQVLDLEDVGL